MKPPPRGQVFNVEYVEESGNVEKSDFSTENSKKPEISENMPNEPENLASDITQPKKTLIQASQPPAPQHPAQFSKIEFYYHPISPPSRAVLFVLKHLNIEHELHELDMVSKEHKQAWYLKMNPNGQVPCLKHDKLFLFESRAIMSYLVNKFSENTREADKLGNYANKRHHAELGQHLFWDLGNMWPNCAPIYRPMLFQGKER